MSTHLAYHSPFFSLFLSLSFLSFSFSFSVSFPCLNPFPSLPQLFLYSFSWFLSREILAAKPGATLVLSLIPAPMTEGMRTRSRAMEDHIHLLNERHDSLFAKMEDLYGSVQQHVELFDTIQKSLATLQIVMTDMIFKPSKMERGPSPSLLPSSLFF